jgi:hypothetical protein
MQINTLLAGSFTLTLGYATLAGLAAAPAVAATPLGPATYGNPNQPWGQRRPVTEQDRALIASYRSGRYRPILNEHFNNRAEFAAAWIAQSDDRYDLKACRDPQSVAISPNGLALQTLPIGHCHARFSTGSIWSRSRFRYGYFEARMRIADAPGLNNAFWLLTDDKFEIDAAELHYPNDMRITLHNNNNWSPDPSHAVGFDQKFEDDLSRGFHDYGVLWRPNEIIFAVDGEPVAAIDTNGAAAGTADIRFSTALGNFGGRIPDDPTGHEMDVKSLVVFGL